MGIEKVIQLAKKAGNMVGNGIAAISSLSSDQMEKIEEKRDEYLKQVPNMNAEQTQEFINKNLNVAGIEVYQTYLEQIKTLYRPLQLLPKANVKNTICSFDITKWVIDAQENSLDKLVNVYHVLSGEKCNIALIYHRSVDGCKVTLGVVNTKEKVVTAATKEYCKRLTDALHGNFPGTEISDNPQFGIPQALEDLTADKNHSVAVVSNLASDKSEKFICQSMEKLLDGIVPKSSEEEYTIVLLANPVIDQTDRINRLFELYSTLMPYSSWQTSFTQTQGMGVNSGANFGIQLGASIGRSSGINEQIGKIEGLTQNCCNFAVQHTLDLIKEQLKRLEQSTALGMWEFAAYIISESSVVANNVAHMYLALTQGEESYLSRSSINMWVSGMSESENKQAAEIIKYVQNLCQPKFGLAAGIVDQFKECLTFPSLVTPSTVLSGKELAKALNFPRKSVSGLPVIECAEFGRNISTYDEQEKGEKLNLGKIFHMNHEEKKTDVSLNMNSLASHTFVTGSTNAGKSNTVYKILDEAQRKGAKFLVVEPAKGEYKKIFGKIDGVSVYGTNPNITPLLRLNPFSFSEEKIHVLEHLDRLVEIFNVCWPMYAAMPAVLKNAVEKSYEDCGWNLTESTNEFGNNRNMYPSFLRTLPEMSRRLSTAANMMQITRVRIKERC